MLLLAATGAAGEAQQSRFLEHPMMVEYDVGITTGDGVRLSADVYLPQAPGEYPTVLLVTPYNNVNERALDTAWDWVRRGYAYVAVDDRGRYDSEGTFDPFRNATVDGSSAISWIAEQPWSNGQVATIGGSYSGMNQWLTAKANNPHHVAMMSYVAPADGFQDLVRYNGVPKLDLIYTWMMGMYGRVNQPSSGWDWPALMRELPLNELDRAAARSHPAWRAWMEHETLDEYWQPMQTTGAYERFDIPSFNVTGWWDGQIRGAIHNYANAVRTGTPAEHMLVIGPWLHAVNGNPTIGDRDYGRTAIINLDSLRNAWLDATVLDERRVALPPVLYFLPVQNEWRQAEAWPVPGTAFTEFYLDSDGGANTLFGDGELQRLPGEGPADEFTYDPANPVPTVSSRTSGARGGIRQGSVDNRAIETRQDVLVYTSEPLEDGVEVTGPVKATIYFSTDVPDTDITVKLLDVYPDGRAHNITHGVARARYRESYTHPKFLEPGEVYAIDVELYPASNYFEPGHQIRLEVSSSNFPNLARNLNTSQSSDTGTEMRQANTRIYHSAKYPSHITLPVVPAGATRPWR